MPRRDDEAQIYEYERFSELPGVAGDCALLYGLAFSLGLDSGLERLQGGTVFSSDLLVSGIPSAQVCAA